MADAYILDYSRFSGVDQSLSQLDTPLHATHDAQNITVAGGILMTAPNDEVVYDPQKGPVMSIIQRVCLDADEKPITELYIATDTKTYWLDESTGSWEETQIIYDQTQGRFDYVN